MDRESEPAPCALGAHVTAGGDASANVDSGRQSSAYLRPNPIAAIYEPLKNKCLESEGTAPGRRWGVISYDHCVAVAATLSPWSSSSTVGVVFWSTPLSKTSDLPDRAGKTAGRIHLHTCAPRLS
jgi:hypothetical protein